MHTETKKYTYDDYAKLPEGSFYQLIDGELIMPPAPSLYLNLNFKSLTYFIRLFSNSKYFL